MIYCLPIITTRQILYWKADSLLYNLSQDFCALILKTKKCRLLQTSFLEIINSTRKVKQHELKSADIVIPIQETWTGVAVHNIDDVDSWIDLDFEQDLTPQKPENKKIVFIS